MIKVFCFVFLFCCLLCFETVSPGGLNSQRITPFPPSCLTSINFVLGIGSHCRGHAAFEFSHFEESSLCAALPGLKLTM